MLLKGKQTLTSILSNKQLLKIFLKISSLLTGYSEIELEATGMKKVYFEVLIRKILGDPKTKKREAIDLLNIYFSTVFNSIISCDLEKKSSDNIDKLIDQIAKKSISKKIIKMWYTGNWYPEETNLFNSEVITKESFKEGLVWKTARTHAPAAKQPGYGSWSYEPIKSSK